MSPLLRTEILNSFVILFHFLNFTAGLAALFIVFKKASLVPALIRRSFFQQTVFYNLTLILSAATDFLDFFFWKTISSDFITLSSLYIINTLALGTYITWAVSFAQMVKNFLGDDEDLLKNKRIKFIFSAVMIYLAFLIFVRILRLIPYIYFTSSIVLVFALLSLVLGYSVYLKRKAVQEENSCKKQALNRLGWLFITFSLINIFVFLNYFTFNFLPPVAAKFSFNIMDLLYNCLIIFWTVRYFDAFYTDETRINEQSTGKQVVSALNYSLESGILENSSILEDSTTHPNDSAAQKDPAALKDSAISKYQISKRELEVIQLVCQGKSNQEIADTLFISLGTVKNHLYNIYAKAGIKSRTQLVKLFE
ncbi:MAG: response regulator transcription factor [Bacillota bacterium]